MSDKAAGVFNQPFTVSNNIASPSSSTTMAPTSTPSAIITSNGTTSLNPNRYFPSAAKPQACNTVCAIIVPICVVLLIFIIAYIFRQMYPPALTTKKGSMEESAAGEKATQKPPFAQRLRTKFFAPKAPEWPGVSRSARKSRELGYVDLEAQESSMHYTAIDPVHEDLERPGVIHPRN